MLDKLKLLLPWIGTLFGGGLFGSPLLIIQGGIALLIFLGGMKVGINLGFRDGYKEGQRSCEKDGEPGRRRLWPWRDELEVYGEPEILEQAVPLP